jgi:hypothetical protein
MKFSLLAVIALATALLCPPDANARFLQTDPVGYKDDVDLYTYVQDDPTDKLDPTGNCPSTECLASDMHGDTLGLSPADVMVLTPVYGPGGAVTEHEQVFRNAFSKQEIQEAEQGLRVRTVNTKPTRSQVVEEHHIVPKGDKRAVQARTNMTKRGINPRTESTNKVFISGDKHDITKRETYVRDVNNRVSSQPDAASIRAECCRIGQELQNSTTDQLDKRYPGANN